MMEKFVEVPDQLRPWFQSFTRRRITVLVAICVTLAIWTTWEPSEPTTKRQGNWRSWQQFKWMHQPKEQEETGGPIDGVLVIAGKLAEQQMLPPGSMFRDAWRTNWAATELPEWPSIYYVAGAPDDAKLAPDQARLPAEKGGEVMAFLTFIIDYYERLPDTMFFLHGHKDSWHSEPADSVWAVNNIRRSTIQEKGFVNLRCQPFPGCPAFFRPLALPKDMISDRPEAELALADVWIGIFNNTDVPEVIGAPGCAQFAVSRDAVKARPRSEYIHFRDYVMDAFPERDPRFIGFIFEYLWHIIFGRPALDCMPVDECLRDKYGFGVEDRPIEDQWLRRPLKYTNDVV
jgi:hypothetical protein